MRYLCYPYQINKKVPQDSLQAERKKTGQLYIYIYRMRLYLQRSTNVYSCYPTPQKSFLFLFQKKIQEREERESQNMQKKTLTPHVNQK